MISLKSTIKFEDNFTEKLIDVIDYETKELLFTKISMSKASKKINVKHSTISIYIGRNGKKPFYENKKTKKRYIFKLSKDENQT